MFTAVHFVPAGNQYWATRGYTAMPGYPKHISEFGFPQTVTKIDAAVYVKHTKKTLFFIEHKYWSYDESRGRMDPGYPRQIYQDFPGIGNKVDAAFENYG
ncbi:MMP3 protein, partial [Polyodon spathula]|nr:MMP3 protein [Polyodon spathula]